MIHIVGIGPGDGALQLKVIDDLARKCDLILGSSRQLETIEIDELEKKRVIDFPFKEIVPFLLKQESMGQSVMYLASGDPMIYGIGNYLSKHLPEGSFEIYPGISSLQYIFSRIPMSMNDCFLSSAHGRQPNYDFLVRMPKLVMVTDEANGPYEIAQELLTRGAKGTMFVGEALSYPEEQLCSYSLDMVPDRDYDMNVVVVLNERS
ncbi:precorrin-6y C5,15-methyltransferase (decarboxylating) subunit CbiE [Suicoccus acidiformans]|uniref:Precorrin-6y C5,15-methyltransferase (Decarboxylating) subunit CbiE n=1 Tax=Suicoccus acidiformans TaxID=2036206 RepID=A0A347WM18_9LACT|nr:precorrin-6y C5,15-methyltransferase (decarboxylating) subunit CbiE [Suicoccus acidiformans]AXY26125.1 precorrin-6y C5,15-methyltransferase (decarboxylating) subunit CbiE [Suicoccus acidiformans]